jgi:hypothetical protein
MQKDSLLNKTDHIYKEISFLSSTRKLSILTIYFLQEIYHSYIINYKDL